MAARGGIFFKKTMPNYDYVCQKCGKDFEVFQSMNDARLGDCLDENCDGTMKRLIGTGAGVIFKGSGFYETDYRSESYKAGAKKDSAGESGSSSGDSGSGKESTASKSDSASSSGSSSGSGASTSAATGSSGGKGE
jgi:putative FmdB family regulatory protein